MIIKFYKNKSEIVRNRNTVDKVTKITTNILNLLNSSEFRQPLKDGKVNMVQYMDLAEKAMEDIIEDKDQASELRRYSKQWGLIINNLTNNIKK